MAAFDHYRNMYDVALKPRLLHTLLKENVPDERHPLRTPSELSYVISLVKTHGLLSESLPESANEKIVKGWKTAVDDWVDRILMLVSSDMPDKCWAGVCLLGVTSCECNVNRFLESYSTWFSQLLLQIQSSAGSQFVKIASCASTSDLLTRLSRFPNTKKEGVSLAGKLIQPILKLLNEDSSDALWEIGCCLLCTIIDFFPSSVPRHYESVEAAIASKIISRMFGPNLAKKLSCCLALLPKSKGDENSWSLMMRRLLLSISDNLHDALEGLEEESARSEAVRLIIQPGQEPPAPLGCGESSKKISKRLKHMLVPTIATLMQSCSAMLTSSYPVQVVIPIHPLLAIIRRVLMVDGSLRNSSLLFTTAMQQEFVCSQLPVLHLHTLELLAAVVKGVRSQLLPHAAYMVRFLLEYLKRCRLPQLRMNVYSIIRILLTSMGVGMALHLSREVTNNASLDLHHLDRSSAGKSKVTVEATAQPNQKKRKLVAQTITSQEQHNVCRMEIEAPRDCSASNALEIAALGALESLLAVGGAMKSDDWRPQVDRLLISVATNAFRKEWTDGERVVIAIKSEGVSVDFQLAALRALLGSLLCPACVRPPFLAQGLDLFRRGKQATGTKVAEFCAHALLALEVLIHPRSLPVLDFPSSYSNTYEGVNGKVQEFGGFGGLKHKPTFPIVGQGNGFGNPDTGYDFLNEKYLENDNSVEVRATKVDNNINAGEKPQGNLLRPQNLETSSSLDDLSGKKASDEAQDPRLTGTDVEMRENGNNTGGKGDEVMDVSLDHVEPDTTVKGGLMMVESLQDSELSPHEAGMAFPLASQSSVGEVEEPGEPAGGSAADLLLKRSVKSDSSNPGSSSLPREDDKFVTRADDNQLKLSTFHDIGNEESSDDDFPDIVDVEPENESD